MQSIPNRFQVCLNVQHSNRKQILDRSNMRRRLHLHRICQDVHVAAGVLGTPTERHISPRPSIYLGSYLALNMRSHNPTLAVAIVTLLAALIGGTPGQNSIPDSKVPNVGDGVYNVNDPSLVNYTFKFLPPFLTDYGGYYC